MAIIFVDGCDQDMRSYKWTASTLTGYGTTGGAFNGGYLSCGSGSSALHYEDPTGTGDTLAMGFWFNSGGSPTNFFYVGNSGFAQSASITWTVGGYLQFNKWGTGAAIATSTDIWVGTGWHWMDLYWKFASGTGGTLKCYIDNVAIVNQTGIETLGSGTADVRRIGWSANTSDSNWVDDVIWYNDTAGGIVYSDFPLGQIRIETLRPNADNTVTWTPSTGVSNYALIDESALNTADYVETTTSTNQDLYDYPSLSFSPAEIKAVAVSTMALDPGGAGAQINHVAKSSGTTSTGSAHSLLAGTDIYTTVFATDPNTSAAWTESGVNAAQFGQKMV